MIPNAYKPQTISLNRLFVLLRRVVWLKNITAKVFFYKISYFISKFFRAMDIDEPPNVSVFLSYV